MRANQLGRTAVACVALGGMAAGAGADISYTSATRSVSTTAATSFERFGYHPSGRTFSGPGLFHAGVFEYASGDYGVESKAWQWSRLDAGGMDLRMSAWGIVNGVYDPGAWFFQSSSSTATARFTLDAATPYWVFIDDNQFTTNGMGRIRTLDGAFDVSFEHSGLWEGLLAPGDYDAQFSVSCQLGGNATGVLSAVIGIPTGGTLALAGTAGLMLLRRRR